MTDDEYYDRLVERLVEVPDVIFDKMKVTVDSDAVIVVGSWVRETRDHGECGCLMFDGATQDPEFNYGELAACSNHEHSRWLYGFYFGEHATSPFTDARYEFVRYSDNIPEYFDQWCDDDEDMRVTLVDGDLPATVRVLSGHGRDLLREMFDTAARRREAVR